MGYNYLCVVRYLGYCYRGWQRQPKLKTVQGTIEKGLSFFFSEDIKINGAGRTDAKVNANGQTFSFVAPREITDFNQFIEVMNRLVPSDISFKKVVLVPDDFHARHSNCGKIYTYALKIGEKDPFEAVTVSQLGNREFDYELYKRALLLFVGIHDFRNFTTKKEDDNYFKREIKSITFREEQQTNYHKIITTFEANGFMTYQIRIMVGIAIKVGEGVRSLEDIRKLLNPSGNERDIVSFLASPCGLTLERVLYE